MVELYYIRFIPCSWTIDRFKIIWLSFNSCFVSYFVNKKKKLQLKIYRSSTTSVRIMYIKETLFNNIYSRYIKSSWKTLDLSSIKNDLSRYREKVSFKFLQTTSQTRMLYYNKHVLLLRFTFSHPLKREKRTEQVHISRKFSRFHICTNFTSHAFVSQRVHNYQSAHAIFRVHTIIAIVKSINSLFYRVLRTDDTGFIHSQIDVETNRCYVNAIVQMVDRQIDRKASRCCLFFFVPLFTD